MVPCSCENEKCGCDALEAKQKIKPKPITSSKRNKPSRTLTKTNATKIQEKVTKIPSIRTTRPVRRTTTRRPSTKKAPSGGKIRN